MAKILVVDDEIQIRELLQRALSKNGYDVITVPSADQALSAVGEQLFDLIILDVQMPGQSGTSFLAKVRNSQNKVPIVIYSGVLTTEMEKELRRAGANEVLTKDIGILSLMKQIEKILRAKGRLFQDPSKQKDQAILVVDDERPIRQLLVNYLSGKNYNVLAAEDGKQALQIAGSREFSVVLLDLHMPGMNGLVTLEKLLEINPKLGVVMITGDPGDRFVKKAMELGAYGFVVKPFDFLYLDLVVMSKLIIAGSN